MKRQIIQIGLIALLACIGCRERNSDSEIDPVANEAIPGPQPAYKNSLPPDYKLACDEAKHAWTFIHPSGLVAEQMAGNSEQAAIARAWDYYEWSTNMEIQLKLKTSEYHWKACDEPAAAQRNKTEATNYVFEPPDAVDVKITHDYSTIAEVFAIRNITPKHDGFDWSATNLLIEVGAGLVPIVTSTNGRFEIRFSTAGGK